MSNFKKLFSIKLISNIIVVSFLVTSSAYPASTPNSSLRKPIDFRNPDKTSPRYLTVLLSAKLQQIILDRRDKVGPKDLPNIAKLEIEQLLKTVPMLCYTQDNEGNIWIYHEPNELYPEGTYIKVYTTGEYPGQFGPGSREEFKKARRPEVLEEKQTHLPRLLNKLAQNESLSNDEFEILKKLTLLDPKQFEVFGITPQNVESELYKRIALFQKTLPAFQQIVSEKNIPDFNIDQFWSNYIPLACWIYQRKINKKPNEAYFLGLCAELGFGKTTRIEILELVLNELLKERGEKVVALSLDDLYKTKEERELLKAKGYSYRGPPGTHDVQLGVRVFKELRQSHEESEIAIPVFNKQIDDRGEQRIVNGKIGIVLFEGWFVGANTDVDPELIGPGFKREVAIALREYGDLFQMLDDLIVYPFHDLETIKEMNRERVQREGPVKWPGDIDQRVEWLYLEPWYGGVTSPEPRFGDTTIQIFTNKYRQIINMKLGGRDLRNILSKLEKKGELSLHEFEALKYLEFVMTDKRQREVFDISPENIELRLKERIGLFLKILPSFRELIKDLEIQNFGIEQLWSIYIPMSLWLYRQRLKKPTNETYFAGFSGADGIGKTVANRIYKLVLSELLKDSHEQVVTLSLDDFYKTKNEKDLLKNKGYSYRGPPGTHDVQLGINVFRALNNTYGSSKVAIPVFNKEIDDRGEPQIVQGKVGIVLFEGWFVGANTDVDLELIEPGFKREVATALSEYKPWFDMLDDLIVRPFHDLDVIKRMYREQLERQRLITVSKGNKWLGVIDPDAHMDAEYVEPWRIGATSPRPPLEEASVIMHTNTNRRVVRVEYGGHRLKDNKGLPGEVYPKLSGTNRNRSAIELLFSPDLLELAKEGGFDPAGEGNPKFVNIGLGFLPFDTIEVRKSYEETLRRSGNNSPIETFATELPGMVAEFHISFSNKDIVEKFKNIAKTFLSDVTRVPLDDISEVILLVSSNGYPYDAGISEIIVGYPKGKERMYRTLVVAPHLTYARRAKRDIAPSQNKEFFREIIHNFFGVDSLQYLIESAKGMPNEKVVVEFDPVRQRFGDIVDSLDSRPCLIAEMNPIQNEFEQINACLLETDNIVNRGIREVSLITAHQVVFHMTPEEEEEFLSTAQQALKEGGVLEIKNIIIGKTIKEDPGFYEISIYQKTRGKLVYIGSVTSDDAGKLYLTENDFRSHFDKYKTGFRQNSLNRTGVKFLFADTFSNRRKSLLKAKEYLSDEDFQRLLKLTDSIDVTNEQFEQELDSFIRNNNPKR